MDKKKYKVSGDFSFLFPLNKKESEMNSWDLINFLEDIFRIALEEGKIDVKGINVRIIKEVKNDK